MRTPKIYRCSRLWRSALCLCALLCLLLTLYACSHGQENATDSMGSATADAENTDSLTDVSDTDSDTDRDSTDDGSHPDEDPTVSETASDTDTDTGIVTLPDETVPDPDTSEKTMPRLDIVTDNGEGILSKETYVHASVTLSNCHENYAFANVGANLRVRGNSTAGAPKKPYRLKFDSKQAMLGLSGNRAFKNWCLMADYYDGSMLRTFGTFKFASALMEQVYFSSDCTHVEVYINGEYGGVYLLCEQTQIHKYRIDIPEKTDGDTSLEHGYLLIGQGGRSDEPGTVVVYPEITVKDRNGDSMYFGGMFFSLSGGDYTDAQKQYVSDYVSGVFKVVARAVYDHEYYALSRDGRMTRIRRFEWAKTDEEKQIETISAVFNIESAVSMCILDEIVKNLDAMTFNMYVDLSPEGDGVLTLAAPWDFDFSMANTHYGSTHAHTGFYATNLSYSEGMRTNLWYVMLGSIDWFEEMVRKKWQENYTELHSVISEMISVNHAYDAAFERDFARWDLPANRSLIHHHDQNDLRTFDTHKKAGTFVTNWLTKRLRWLNTQWGDGTDIFPPADRAPELELVFTDEASTALITDLKRCDVTLTGQGLHLTPSAEAHDPYFSFRYDRLANDYEAADYPYLEFTYRIPASASADTYVTELFLCAGNVTDAIGGVSTSVEIKADGAWHTVRVDLESSGYWEGTIHAVRMDFFTVCAPGDEMYLKTFKLLPE